jgi:hypothetical protein
MNLRQIPSYPAFRHLRRSTIVTQVLVVPLLTMMLICSTGCMTAAKMNKVMSSWEGADVNYLIARWGPPTQIMNDGNGGRIFVYTYNRSYTTAGVSTTTTTGSANGTATTSGDNTSVNIYGQSNSTTVYSPAQTTEWKVYRMFWVGPRGHVYRWAWRGL